MVFRAHTFKHQLWVIVYLLQFSLKLIWRGLRHDLSKYTTQEARRYGWVLPRLRGVTFGSRGYQDLLDELKPAIDHHYKHNSHHPQYSEWGVKGMDLFDLVEMWCDWRASIKKHDDGDIVKSVEHNRERFGMQDTADIYMNTAKGLTGDVSEKSK